MLFFSLLHQFTNNKLACYSNKTSGIESDDCHHRTIVFLGHKLTSCDHRSSTSTAISLSLSLLHPLFPSIVPATEISAFCYAVTQSIQKIFLKSSFFFYRKKDSFFKNLIAEMIFFHNLPTQSYIKKNLFVFFLQYSLS